jgi:chromate transporter
MQDGGIPAAILGAVVATLGLITPSVIIILIVASILKSFRNNPYVERAFYGLRPASVGLIGAAGISVVISNLFMSNGTFALNWKGLLLAVVLWVLTNVVKQTKKWHPIIFIGFSALIGILFQLG